MHKYSRNYFTKLIEVGPQTKKKKWNESKTSLVEANVRGFLYYLCMLDFWKQLYQEEFEDTKRVIRTRKSKDRQRIGQIDLQNVTHKTKDRVTRTLLNYESATFAQPV